MKIVIDIPEYIYKICQSHGDIVYKSIANGTPLPKGHGRLVDADELIKDRVENDNIVIFVNTARTIIEADRAERSDKE